MKAARTEKLGDASYVEQGDTAMFVFDQVVLDLDGRNEYYHNGADLPVETDTYTAFHASLDKAAANPKIKNFVIDLAANVGGESFSMSAMAAILSDRGILILGEKSGGGSCSFQYCGTADGWLYTIFNNIHLINQAGEDIDSGVPVEESLVTEGKDGSRDYSKYYDLNCIRECIANHIW